MANALDVLRNRDFRIYWTGQAVSLVGTWMQTMAQGWVITGRTSSAAVLGALNITGTLPMLLLGMKAGELADRVEKRRMLLITQVVLALLAAGASALLFSGKLEVWHLFVMAALFGTAAAFEMPVSQAFAPELVEPHEITRAVGLMQSIFHGSRLFGPALAGLCIQAWGEGSAFLANALSFVAVIISLLLIKPHHPAQGGRPRGGGSFREGLKFVSGSPTLRSLFILHVLVMTFAFPFISVLMPFFARHVLGADASAMGQVMSASGLGSLVGSVVIILMAGGGWRIRLLVGVAGMSLALGGLSTVTTAAAAMAAVAVNAFSTSMVMGTIMQTAQQDVPGHLRGRVMALFGMSFSSVLPLAGLLLSWLADQFDVTRVMAASAALFAVSAAAALLLMQRALAAHRAA